MAMAINARHPSERGFTLLELMIVLVVIAILSAIAYPSFIEQIRKGRRADAITALNQIQQAQERWRVNCPCYAGSITAANAGCPATACATSSGLGLSGTSANAYYTVGISNVSATGYTLTATATGPQAADTKCASMSVALAGGNLTYTASPTANANLCWNR
jgi:type IV pilus assembly protein PilE